MRSEASPLLTSYIGGSVVAHGGARLELIRPQDGVVGAILAEAGAFGVQRAVENASEAFRANRCCCPLIPGQALWG
jgi:hypothetical protein